MEYHEILKSALANVPEELDKREGSIIYTAIAPIAYELAKAYWVISWLTNLLFPDTAENDWLDRNTEMFGVTRKAATHAVRKVFVFDQTGQPMSISIGSRFRLQDLTVAVSEEVSSGVYLAKAEQNGTIGNRYEGPCLAITNIEGLGAVLLGGIVIHAVDQETDEELRERFYVKVRTSPFGGNVADYEQKILDIEGVGAVQVIPIWNGPGTVLVIIGDELGRTATPELIQTVQMMYHPESDPHSGLAPVGAAVTVATSTPLDIDITAGLILAAGASFELVQSRVSE